MLQITHDQDFLQFKFSTGFSLIKKIISEIRSFFSQCYVENESNIILLIRELLNNSIEHGNKNDSSLIIKLSIRKIAKSRFKIIIEDQGQGFDYNNMDISISDDPTQIRNRGLGLINAFADEVVYNSKGNIVTVYVTCEPETDFEIFEDNDFKIIRPTGDITSEIAEKFRSTLLKLIEDKNQKFRFDLKNVKDIDSIVLSLFVVFSNMINDRFSNSELEIINANPDVLNLFYMTYLNKVYKIIN